MTFINLEAKSIDVAGQPRSLSSLSAQVFVQSLGVVQQRQKAVQPGFANLSASSRTVLTVVMYGRRAHFVRIDFSEQYHRHPQRTSQQPSLHDEMFGVIQNGQAGGGSGTFRPCSTTSCGACLRRWQEGVEHKTVVEADLVRGCFLRELGDNHHVRSEQVSVLQRETHGLRNILALW